MLIRKVFVAIFVSVTSLNVNALDIDLVTDSAIGGVVGGAFGGAVGAIVGGRDGAIVGAGVGAAAGTAINTEKYKGGSVYTNRSYSNDYGRYQAKRSRFCPPGQAKKGRC